MANDSAKKMLATNTALMKKYTRMILGCNVRRAAKNAPFLAAGPMAAALHE